MAVEAAVASLKVFELIFRERFKFMDVDNEINCLTR